jgi:hypothetical protein
VPVTDLDDVVARQARQTADHQATQTANRPTGARRPCGRAGRGGDRGGAGVTVTGQRVRTEPRTDRPPRLRLAMVVVGLLSVLAAGLGIGVRATHGGHAAVDEPQYLLSALSLWQDHDLDISDELADRRFLAFHDLDLPVQTALRPDGSQLSPHDPLLPVLLAVPMGLGGWVAAKLTLAVLAGILAALLLWVAVRRFAVPPRLAVPGVALATCTAPLAVYGQQVYPELPGALAALVAVAALTAPRPTPRTLAGPRAGDHRAALAVGEVRTRRRRALPGRRGRPVAGAPAPGRRRPHRRARRRRGRLPGRAQGDLRRHHRVRQRRPVPELRRVRRGRPAPGLPGPVDPAARAAGRPRLRHRRMAAGLVPGHPGLVALLAGRPRHWPALVAPLLAAGRPRPGSR